ncbi:MAG: hypothetical protein ACOX9R_09385 [Armatimonadota bacterium]|jgi:uncharacterized protein YwgA
MTDRKVLLLMLYMEDGGQPGVKGITRLQKYMFLVKHRCELPAPAEEETFEPYKFGPYSPELYDDLEFLENLGLIEGKPVASDPEAESVAAEEAELSFDYLLSDDEEQTAKAEVGDREFVLTAKGRDLVESSVLPEADDLLVQRIRAVKSKFSSYSLRDLLRYVYQQFPEWTRESEIREHLF